MRVDATRFEELEQREASVVFYPVTPVRAHLIGYGTKYRRVRYFSHDNHT